MMRTTPLRLMTLHLGQMGLTLARTFMALSSGFGRKRRELEVTGVARRGRRTGQYPRTLIQDRDRVLEVRGHRAIFGYCGPFVIELLHVRGPGVYHGFDGDDKT